jgi:hypothetical protein
MWCCRCPQRAILLTFNAVAPNDRKGRVSVKTELNVSHTPMRVGSVRLAQLWILRHTVRGTGVLFIARRRRMADVRFVQKLLRHGKRPFKFWHRAVSRAQERSMSTLLGRPLVEKSFDDHQ